LSPGIFFGEKNMKTRYKFISIVAIAAFSSMPASAVEMQEVIDAAKTKPTINLRYRYEDVSQDGVADDAGASTLRSRFSWKSGAVSKFSVGFEADYVSVIGSERFNSTHNGKGNFPVVADPEGFDLNQSYVNYSGEMFNTTFGRQRINLGSQRFVGGVGWRQNEQTFDALRTHFTAQSKLKVDYAYVWNVNRIFGPDDGAQPADWHGDSHLLTVTMPFAEGHSLGGFSYLLDFENGNGLPNSSATYGVGYKGVLGPAKLTATFATQSDYADSPLKYDAAYYLLQVDAPVGPVSLTVGYEVLGTDDGVAAFRTPLATSHKFQGWADKFLGTPANGIEDIYVGVKGKVGSVAIAATWHELESDEGGLDYGSELDLVATYAVNKNVKLQFKFADYHEKGFATDSTKFWMSAILNM
jgi:hypothetical protein